MGEVIGAVLPLAVGVAISPIPIIAAILMLLSPQATGNGLSFLVGWLAGIVVAVTVVVLVSTAANPSDSDDSSTATAWVALGLGAVFLALAVMQWRARPRPGEEPTLPKWMKAIDSITPVKALAFGFLLSALNPKNLAMCISAGVEIGTAELGTTDIIIVVAIFTLLAGSSIAVPVVGYLVAADRMRGPLDDLRGWLVTNNATVMSVLLLVIGVVKIGQGIGGI